MLEFQHRTTNQLTDNNIGKFVFNNIDFGRDHIMVNSDIIIDNSNIMTLLLDVTTYQNTL